MSTPLLQPYSLELVPVTTSLELQMFVRRMLERDDAIRRDDLKHEFTDVRAELGSCRCRAHWRGAKSSG